MLCDLHLFTNVCNFLIELSGSDKTVVHHTGSHFQTFSLSFWKLPTTGFFQFLILSLSDVFSCDHTPPLCPLSYPFPCQAPVCGICRYSLNFLPHRPFLLTPWDRDFLEASQTTRLDGACLTDLYLCVWHVSFTGSYPNALPFIYLPTACPIPPFLQPWKTLTAHASSSSQNLHPGSPQPTRF